MDILAPVVPAPSAAADPPADASPPGPVVPRVGWVCNWLDPSLGEAELKALNLRDTTVAAVSRLDRSAAVEKLLGLVRHNAAALMRQVAMTAALPPGRRAMRIASSVLPVYTHPAARPLYGEPALREAVEALLPPVGEAAVAGGVRLSTHPGQYCVLATASRSALDGAVAEVEYHVEVMRLLGHAGGWHPRGAHVNVHGGARGPGIAAFRESFVTRLSEDARGLLTVENDEVAYGLDDLLPLADALPLVLDLHHHWVATGEYIRPDDPRVARVRDSWRGTRPMGHVSAPREALAPSLRPDRLPDRAALLAEGVTARDLRNHATTAWNRAHTAWAASHLAWTDLEVEAKGKNLASADFADRKSVV